MIDLNIAEFGCFFLGHNHFRHEDFKLQAHDFEHPLRELPTIPQEICHPLSENEEVD